MVKRPAAPLSLQQLLELNEIEQLDVLKEIDALHKYIANLYVDRNYTAVQTHVPHLTRRWDAFNRLLVKRENLIADAANPRKAPESQKADYTGPGYDYY